MSNDALGDLLLILARNAIGRELGTLPTLLPSDLKESELAQPGATFVTLTQQGALRGCIGSLEAWRPLRQDVEANALAAAFRDPRFSPLRRNEFPGTRVEVSLLTPAEPMDFTNEEDALKQLRPGTDGLIFTAGHRRSTFLPQVWESLPEPRQFLAHLKQKAGLPADYWSPDVQLDRYGVRKWKEAER